MEFIDIILQNADKLTVITILSLVVMGLIYALIWVFKYVMAQAQAEKNYLISQVTERNLTIQEMTKVLLESQEVLTKLTSAIENNKKEIVVEIENRILSLKGEIQNAIINGMQGAKK